MKTFNFHFAGHTEALDFCRKYLRYHGCDISSAPNSSVTHLILPVPSFSDDGCIKGGDSLPSVLQQLPKEITVIGGKLQHPALAGYRTIDLLEDPVYLSENANITAYCALKQVMQHLKVTLQGCPILVIGWGRIGKCLARLLRQLGARVSVYARKEADRAMLLALGYETADITPPAYDLMRYRVIFNTAPAMLLPAESLENCRGDCLKIDLASNPGIASKDVIWARGLPNRDAPESSGILMGQTILRLVPEKESTL